MNKRNYLLWLVCALFSVNVFVSCSDNDDPTPSPESGGVGSGAYILSSGVWGMNNSTLDFYDFETGEVKEDVFKTLSGRDLGDTANDLLIYGSKMYIAVNVSNQIEVTDLNGKSLKQITPENSGSGTAGPRYFAAYGGKVYVSLYDGYIARIDTTDLVIEEKVEVGVGVEQLCVSEGKIYTVISSYPPNVGTTVKEVDINSFEVTKEFEVAVNPTQIKADKNGMLYVVSTDYSEGVKATLQQLDPESGEITELFANSMINITQEGDYVYVLTSEVDPAWVVLNTEYKKYDTNAGEFESKSFVNSDVQIKDAQSLNVNPVTNQIYINAGTSSATGDIYIISDKGALDKKLSVSGYFPVCVRFIDVNR